MNFNQERRGGARLRVHGKLRYMPAPRSLSLVAEYLAASITASERTARYFGTFGA